MHHSAENDQFVFHTFFLASYTDQSTLTMCHAHYAQLISMSLSNVAMFVAIGIQVVTCTGRSRVAFCVKQVSLIILANCFYQGLFVICIERHGFIVR